MVYLVIAAVVVWILQTALGFWQFKRFGNHVKDLRKIGRVAIGKARGGFVSGVIILFVIDESCRIVKGEIMQGRTVFANFKPFDKFNGLALFELNEEICKSLKIGGRETSAVVSARQDYENYQIIKADNIIPQT